MINRSCLPLFTLLVKEDPRDGGRDDALMLSHMSRSELSGRPVAAIAVRGKELQLDSTVGAARRLLAGHAVKVLPVLSGPRYVGAVDNDALAGAGDEVPVRTLARSLVPVATARTPAVMALEILDEHGGTRLVVVDDDRATYVGLVCLRGDRSRLCVDVERFDGDKRGTGR